MGPLWRAKRKKRQGELAKSASAKRLVRYQAACQLVVAADPAVVLLAPFVRW